MKGIIRQPEVDPSGKAITIYFPSTFSNLNADNFNANCLDNGVFHAAWLWSNAPSNTMTPSGQKRNSPGAFPSNCTIQCADVVKINDLTSDNTGIAMTTMSSFSPPSIPSVHPVSTSCKETKNNNVRDSGEDKFTDRYVLVLTWKNFHYNNQHNKNSYSTSADKEATTASRKNNDNATTSCCYDLNWLQQWAYATSSKGGILGDKLHQKRTQREVTNRHTFMHKYKESLNSRSRNFEQEEKKEEQLGRDRNNGDNFQEQEHLSSNGENNSEIGNGILQGKEIEENTATGKRLPKHKGLRSVDFDSIVYKKSSLEEDDAGEKEDALLELLDAIFLDGAAIVTSCPIVSPEEEDGPQTPVSQIGKAMAGSLSHGALYGDIFHVKSQPEAINIAFTSEHLCPHQDLAYYESIPGLQLLHCNVAEPESRMKGGESILIDCMAAAHTLREIAPDLFQILVSCPATFVKQREGALMTYCRPHIALKEDESSFCDYANLRNGLSSHHQCTSNSNFGTKSIKESVNREIVAVRWSPPFEGPLSLPFETVMPYYKAYSAFELMLDNSIDGRQRQHFQGGPKETSCSNGIAVGNDDNSVTNSLDPDLQQKLSRYANEYTWEYRLQPGDMIVFNNMRMLHGRRSFDNTGAEQHESKSEISPSSSSTMSSSNGGSNKPCRHLIGAYTNIDDSLNTYRVLLGKEQRRKAHTSRIIPNVGNGTSSVLP